MDALPIASAVFAAYARNSGNNPDEHHDRNAAEQWMAQALGECGVYELIEAGNVLIEEWDRQDKGRFDGMTAKAFFAAEARYRAALATLSREGR